MKIKLPRHCHFIGIGGIGMSGLAKILIHCGFSVSGSDVSFNDQIEELTGLGAQITIGHDAQLIASKMAVIYSSGIKIDNPELIAAKQLACELYHRADLLDLLTKTKKTLAVTGCHGKTTTASLLVHILETAQYHPSYVIGGVLNASATNAHWGSGEWLVIEADESDGTFLKYHPYGAILTNIDEDHLDYYKNRKNIKKAFAQFVSQVQNNQHCFTHYTEEACRCFEASTQYYGFSDKLYPSELKNRNLGSANSSAHLGIAYRAKIISHQAGYPTVRFSMNNEEFEAVVPLLGAHNVLNALAVFSLAYSIGIPGALIVKGLETFRGVKRRCELKGSVRGITLMDDYAHHPTAIEATLRGLCEFGADSIIAVFQPHRYSRMKHSMHELNRAFAFADKVIITDIYAAGEKAIKGITVEAIHKLMGPNCCYCPRDQLAHELAPLLRPGDLLLSLGAGNITDLADEILDIYRSEPPLKLKVGLISGGRSTESLVSMDSVKQIARGLDEHFHDRLDFFIDQAGYWSSRTYKNTSHQRLPAEILRQLQACDLVIPMLHGPYGEDGTVQGLFETLGIPYAFSNVGASSLCMDKSYTKYLAQGCKIPTAEFTDIQKKDWLYRCYILEDWIKEDVHFPVFVKGAHLGSSIGVYYVETPAQALKALDAAFALDDKVLIEQAVHSCREVEVVVVAGATPTIFPPFEIIKKERVHDYAGKYTADGNGVNFHPNLTPEQKELLFVYSRLLFDKLHCEGIVRIDFFIDQEGVVLFNEINPIPGFTEFSGATKLFEASGFDMKQVLVILIKSAMKAHRKQMKVWQYAKKDREAFFLY